VRPPPLRFVEDVEPRAEVVRLLPALPFARLLAVFELLPLLLLLLLPLLRLLPLRLPPPLRLVLRREVAVPLLLPLLLLPLLLLPLLLLPLLRLLPLLDLLPELPDDFVLRPEVWRERWPPCCRPPCSCLSPAPSCCSSPESSSPISFFATPAAAVVATPAATPTATFFLSEVPSSSWGSTQTPPRLFR
jgi:hypothetical protein